MTVPPIELPEKYYLDYFESLLAFVEEKSGHLLSRKEKNFYRKFRALPEDARCLFIRLTNRKGCFFRTEKLDYPEIKDLSGTLSLLCQQKFFSPLLPRHTSQLREALSIFTKPELLTLLKLIDPEATKPLRSLKKAELLTQAAATFPARKVIQAIRAQELVVRVNYEAEIEMLRFLYFGDIHSDMTQFVVRGMGIIKHETYDESKLQAFFKTRKEAEDKLTLSKVYQAFKVLRDQQQAPADHIYQWFVTQHLSQEQFCEVARPLFDKLSLRLGKLLEQQQHPTFALSVYQHTDKAPARERRARLLHKLAQTEAALQVCLEIQQHPQNAEERFFAEDFWNRLQKKKRTKRTTDFLKSSRSVALEETNRYSVEFGVLEHYQQQGYHGVHTENYLWRSFFGLLFWDIIFDQDCEALHNPLQITPADFYTPHFLEKRQTQLQQRLTVLEHPSRFYNIIGYHYETKVGTSNPMVGWHESVLPLVTACYEKLTPVQIGNTLLEMAKDLKENTRGFPDLFVWNETTYNFIEVKSPNDHLSAQQLHWLTFFQSQGICAEVVRVEWE